MSKPSVVEWLEEQTGESFHDVPAPDQVQPNDRVVSFHVPEDLYRRLRHQAQAEGCSLAAVIRRLVSSGLDDADAPDPASIDRAIAALEALRRASA